MGSWAIIFLGFFFRDNGDLTHFYHRNNLILTLFFSLVIAFSLLNFTRKNGKSGEKKIPKIALRILLFIAIAVAIVYIAASIFFGWDSFVNSLFDYSWC